MSARMRLRRGDGTIYLDRWGIEWKPLGGVFLHKMSAPDPGKDLHDHPWWFFSVILWGGYSEERALTRDAVEWAQEADLAESIASAGPANRGRYDRHRWLSIRYLGRHECHTIRGLLGRTSWSLVVHGPNHGQWGFYTPEGWEQSSEYHRSERGRARDLVSEESSR